MHQETVLPVASPSFLKSNSIENVKDLAKVPILLDVNARNEKMAPSWEVWTQHAGIAGSANLSRSVRPRWSGDGRCDFGLGNRIVWVTSDTNVAHSRASRLAIWSRDPDGTFLLPLLSQWPADGGAYPRTLSMVMR